MCMAKIIVKKSSPLIGEVNVNGAKNSALPVLAASLLAQGECLIENVPVLKDVEVMLEIISYIGSGVEFDRTNCVVKINNRKFKNKKREICVPYELASKLRASFLITGALLAKYKIVKMPLPGGCAIGTRPVDLHLKGLGLLGAKIETEHGYIIAKCPTYLTGNNIYLDFPSVGATENILIAASSAKGQTVIQNAATEPEIVDLALFLSKMGADIKGAGTDTIKITGNDALTGTQYSIMPDRIEAGTLMIAAAITEGNVRIKNIEPGHLKPVTAKLKEIGVEISEEISHIDVKGVRNMKPADIKTMPYPGFPTDMQSQIMALLTKAEGTSVIVETIFENRFMHVPEFNRMGANILIEGRSAIVKGGEKMTGASVKATDLRAGAALVLAGLAAEGETIICDAEYIDRGYYRIEEKLKSLGADIFREI